MRFRVNGILEIPAGGRRLWDRASVFALGRSAISWRGSESDASPPMRRRPDPGEERRRWWFHGIPAVRLLIGNLERHRRQVAQGEAALLPLALASGRLQLYFGEGLQNQIVSGACLQLVAVSFQHEFETVV